MIKLDPVNEKTFGAVVDMRLSEEQNRFVAPNVVSLAQAWLNYEAARPYAVLDDDRVVGFLMLDWDEAERTAGIWRFMIDPKEQRKGYGRAALQAAIKLIRAADRFDAIYLDYVPSNTVAHKLYDSFGFRENGDVEDGEIVMMLPLTDTPKVGMLTADEEDLEQLQRRLAADAEAMPEAQAFPEWTKEIVRDERLTRFTVMGETAGLTDGERFWFRKKYESYRDEALARWQAAADHT